MTQVSAGCPDHFRIDVFCGRRPQRKLESPEMKDRARRSDAREQDIATLRREREDVRERIEKLIDQIDVLTKAERAG